MFLKSEFSLFPEVIPVVRFSNMCDECEEFIPTNTYALVEDISSCKNSKVDSTY
jgi:hypothetical protein